MFVVFVFVLPIVGPVGAKGTPEPDPAATRMAQEELESAGFDVRTRSSLAMPVGTSPSKVFMILAAPSRALHEEEFQRVHDVVAAGGTFLLVDEGVFGPSITVSFGIEYRTRPVVCQGVGMDSSFVLVNGTVGATTFSVLLDSPVALSDVRDDNEALWPLMRTDAECYQDLNNDGVIGVVDGKGPFNVGLVALSSTQGGRFMAISDSGWLQDPMIGRAQNGRFLVALASEHRDRSGGDVVIFVDGPEENVREDRLPANGIFLVLCTLVATAVVLRRAG